MEPNNKAFLDDIHFFRGFAILLIVSSHLLYVDMSSEFYIVISAIYLNSTIFFAVISGYLFQHLIYKYEYKEYIKRKWLNVILPYLVVSIPAIALRLWQGPSYSAVMNNPEIEGASTLYQVGYYLVSGTHLLPLWYLPMIAIFFVIAPVFKFIDDNPKLYWLIPVFMVVSLLIPRDLQNMHNIPRMFGHFFSVYLFGMFYSRFRHEIYLFTQKWFWAILAVFTGMFVASLWQFEYRNQVIFIQKVLAVLLIVHAFKYVKAKWLSNLLDKLANTSFGIYFIHFYIILVIRMLSQKFLGSEYPDNSLFWIATYVLVICASYVSVMIVKRIFKRRSRYLIGS